MRFTLSMIALPALAATIAFAQAQTQPMSPNMTMPTSALDPSTLPACFTACAQRTATTKDVGCTGLTDIKCVCSKPNFAEQTNQCIMTSKENDCPKTKENTTAIEMGTKVLQGLCTAAGTGNATTPTAGTGTGTGTGTAASAGAGNTTSTKSRTKNGASGQTVPFVEFAASIALVMSALFVGTLTLM